MNSRKVFVETLSELAQNDPKVMLLVMDVGFSYIEDFQKDFPNQYINLGVTEQSATGIAAGMALSGFKPYLYSMVPFVLLRNAEQVRNDIVKHNANVKLIGVKGSEHYKFLGFSHNIDDDRERDLLHALEIPYIWTGEDVDVKGTVQFTYESNSPYYIRL
jgi:transketolase